MPLHNIASVESAAFPEKALPSPRSPLLSTCMSSSSTNSSLQPPEQTLRPALKRDSSRPLSDGTHNSTDPPSPPVVPSGVRFLHPTSGTMNPPGYTNKVSFDTFENGNSSDASMFSYTLQATSAGYHKSRSTRVFLCAASADSSGSEALDWAMESLVQDGDELIVVRGFDVEDLQKETHEDLREEARELMKSILEKNSSYEGRSLSVIVEFVGGRITETIERLIALYRPESLVVGTRGPRSTLKTWGAVLGAPGMGSVSRYCVSRSPVPVIVVQPERKVRKSVEKRRADPRRHIEFDESSRRLLRPRNGSAT